MDTPMALYTCCGIWTLLLLLAGDPAFVECNTDAVTRSSELTKTAPTTWSEDNMTTIGKPHGVPTTNESSSSSNITTHAANDSTSNPLLSSASPTNSSSQDTTTSGTSTATVISTTTRITTLTTTTTPTKPSGTTAPETSTNTGYVILVIFILLALVVILVCCLKQSRKRRYSVDHRGRHEDAVIPLSAVDVDDPVFDPSPEKDMETFASAEASPSTPQEPSSSPESAAAPGAMTADSNTKKVGLELEGKKGSDVGVMGTTDSEEPQVSEGKTGLLEVVDLTDGEPSISTKTSMESLEDQLNENGSNNNFHNFGGKSHHIK